MKRKLKYGSLNNEYCIANASVQNIRVTNADEMGYLNGWQSSICDINTNNILTTNSEAFVSMTGHTIKCIPQSFRLFLSFKPFSNSYK